MLINLTDYFKNPDKNGSIQLKYEGDSLSVGADEYPIREKEELETTVKNIGNGKVQISGHGVFGVSMACGRCLKPVEVPVEIDFDYTVNEPDGFLEQDEDSELFMEGYELNGNNILRNELIMGLPMKVLCKDDCKGLCPVCGSNRNEGECGCDTFVPDPRMAAIQDIFNANNKEV